MVQSCASGHQTSNSNARSGGGSWALHRNAKLAVQAQSKTSNIFDGVICYINGYTGTDAAGEQRGNQLEEEQADKAEDQSGFVDGSKEEGERTWSNEMIKDAIESGGGIVR